VTRINSPASSFIVHWDRPARLASTPTRSSSSKRAASSAELLGSPEASKSRSRLTSYPRSNRSNLCGGVLVLRRNEDD
jgi:hypothetical protein